MRSKETEETNNAPTHEPTKQHKEAAVKENPPRFVTPSEDPSTKDTGELVKVIHPDSFQLAPEENPHTAHEESQVPPTSPTFAGLTVDNDSLLTTDGAASESTPPTEEHMFGSESPDWLVHSSTSEADLDEERHEGSDLPVSQEDHTTDVTSDRPSVTESAVLGKLEEVTADSAVGVSPRAEESDARSTTLLPSLTNSTYEDQSVEPEEETGDLTDDNLVGFNISSVSEEVPASNSSKKPLN